MKPTLGRIVHVWDHVYGCWRAAIVTEAHSFSVHCFVATMFRSSETLPGMLYYYDQENKEAIGGWRWPPREEV